MKHHVATLLLCLPLIALAEEPSTPEPRRLEGVLSIGYVYGGDTCLIQRLQPTAWPAYELALAFWYPVAAHRKISPKLGLQRNNRLPVSRG